VLSEDPVCRWFTLTGSTVLGGIHGTFNASFPVRCQIMNAEQAWLLLQATANFCLEGSEQRISSGICKCTLLGAPIAIFFSTTKFSNNRIFLRPLTHRLSPHSTIPFSFTMSTCTRLPSSSLHTANISRNLLVLHQSIRLEFAWKDQTGWRIKQGRSLFAPQKEYKVRRAMPKGLVVRTCHKRYRFRSDNDEKRLFS
jgi:hypothetical protein